MERKKQRRNAAAARRDSLPEQQRKTWSEAACEAAVSWLEHHRTASFMVYVSFRTELDTSLLIEWGWQSGLNVIVPRCIPQDRSMELFAIRDWRELKPGAYGILEPDPTKAIRLDIDKEMPEAVFVPGLAFDRSGGRLGYGGGYYDRFRDRLAASAANAGGAFPPWIGLGYEAQWVEAVPMEIHDARVSAVITEQGIYNTGAV
ncbi:5-formyltetrahydrofolate cyclo-ligase [Paenibacillus spongiae]|uniref:5-formyltetrahydrofolate cyclo-ligase n=1 Tax=Paenibacillus spongiae TaxID=2909671 RepID=A0ABY5SCA5_9BACL|nr:5-formyltetrahydrofolate cyclo-ligase [Paenibacillus spongiae]UVI31163.1 5-formyltetrahydrofolate cyclo-ligase [Paenibacillus spongiae]